jgi:hypothetical protein
VILQIAAVILQIAAMLFDRVFLIHVCAACIWVRLAGACYLEALQQTVQQMVWRDRPDQGWGCNPKRSFCCQPKGQLGCFSQFGDLNLRDANPQEGPHNKVSGISGGVKAPTKSTTPLLQITEGGCVLRVSVAWWSWQYAPPRLQTVVVQFALIRLQFVLARLQTESAPT